MKNHNTKNFYRLILISFCLLLPMKAAHAQAVGTQNSGIKKTVRLKPKIHFEILEQAVKTIPPHVIEPFLTASLILDAEGLRTAGYVLGGVDDELAMGKYSDFYARGMQSQTGVQKYSIFRVGRRLAHPKSGQILGIEGIHVGQAEMVRVGKDISRLHITNSNQEVVPGDRLVAQTSVAPLPYYEPRPPSADLNGWIIHSPNGVKEVGKFQVLIITGGTEDGLADGHVLKTEYQRGSRVDPVTGEQYVVPNEESGRLMVIKAYGKLSYALVLESYRQIVIGDPWVSS